MDAAWLYNWIILLISVTNSMDALPAQASWQSVERRGSHPVYLPDPEQIQ